MPAWQERSTTSSFAGSTTIPLGRGGWSSIRELVEELFAGDEAWVVGGAVRDAAVGRPVVDVDVALAQPEAAARTFARRSGGFPFQLSERHGAWRVALDGGRTVDFTPLAGAIGNDLASRDFTINAIAERVGGGEVADPYGGRRDIAAKTLRAVSDSVFDDDPLRLLRAVRLAGELEFELDDATEGLIRRSASRVVEPAGERVLAELRRLRSADYERLHELGLLEPLGGSLELFPQAAVVESPDYLLVVHFGERALGFPVSNDLRRFARALLRAQRPDDDSSRAIHRFRRATEPWAVEALLFLGATELEEAVRAARKVEPKHPLVRGGELGLPPGPEIGRLLAEIEEERAAGTVTTKKEALEYARRNASSIRGDG